MTVPKSIEQPGYDPFAYGSERGENQQPEPARALRKTLTPVQFGLIVAVGVLVIAVQILILRTYFNSSNTANEFKEASFLFTSLADIQREVLLLQLETNRVFQDPNPDIKSLKLRRALLANQLRLQSNQSADKPLIAPAVKEIKSTLDQYDTMLARFTESDMSMASINPDQIYDVLSGLGLQTKTLYDQEEQRFFEAFKITLNTQRVSQALLLTVDGLVLVLGVILFVSITRTVRALNTENAERRRAEEALIDANESLERRVEERTSELSSANDRLQQEVFERALAQRELRAFTGKLEESNRELESFASIAAHDLQEPLRKVQAFGDRLKTKFADELGEQGRDYLVRMQDASGRMATLINDLLAYSRVTTKAQPFANLDMDKLANEVVSDLEIRIEEVKGTVELGDIPSIDAEPLQMRQLFQNLIGNGLKYHKEDVPPIITVSAQIIGDRPGSTKQVCQITFKDNGIGFDEKYSDRIFGIFQRLHTRNDYDGTGVGLAIVKKIAERHSGKIVANSVPDVGSTFVVTLPVKQKSEQSEETE